MRLMYRKLICHLELILEQAQNNALGACFGVVLYFVNKTDVVFNIQLAFRVSKCFLLHKMPGLIISVTVSLSYRQLLLYSWTDFASQLLQDIPCGERVATLLL